MSLLKTIAGMHRLAVALRAVALGLCVLCLAAGVAWGQEPPPETQPEAPPESQSETQPGPDLLEGIEEPPAEDTPEPPAEPAEDEAPAPGSIEEIASQMQRVESRLREADSGATTQQMQHQIVDALAQFIEQMKKSQGQSGDPSQSPMTPPSSSQQEPEPAGQEEPPETNDDEHADESTEREGHEPGEAPEEQVAREDLLRQAWGHLPGRAGREMPNAATERFLPQYEREIEAYFRRLAEEQPSDAL